MSSNPVMFFSLQVSSDSSHLSIVSPFFFYFELNPEVVYKTPANGTFIRKHEVYIELRIFTFVSILWVFFWPLYNCVLFGDDVSLGQDWFHVPYIAEEDLPADCLITGVVHLHLCLWC